MALHPAEEAPLDWDPIRRELDKSTGWYRDLADRQKNGIITGPHFELVYSMFVRDQS